MIAIELRSYVRSLICQSFFSARNYRSRLHNSQLGIYDDAVLEPLMSLQTHQLIDSFPENVRAIDRMNSAQLNNLLTELEEHTDGTGPTKKARVKGAIGIPSRELPTRS